MKRLLALTGLVALIIPGALVYNNVSWGPSGSLFDDRLERAAQLGTDWVVGSSQEPGALARNNPILFYMLADMASLSGDQRLRAITSRLLDARYVKPGSVWLRLLDPSVEVHVPAPSEIAALEDYQRWLVYAIAQREVHALAGDRSAMFAPDRFVWGSRTHQLLALLLYRSRVERTPDLDQLIEHLCDRIAAEAVWDVRVTDLYVQRLAFVVAAGRPDLVRRRWVERVIGSQTTDGGWVQSWYGWGPRLLEFRLGRTPNPHTTIQAVWLLYMLKFRYPEWMRRAALAVPHETGL